MNMPTYVGMPRLPAGGREARWPTPSCGATSRHATHTIRDEAGRRSSTSSPTGRPCATGAARSRTRLAPTRRALLRFESRRSLRRRRPCTGRATPTRPTRSSPTWSGRPARPRSSRSSRWRPRRSASTRPSRRPGITAFETDLAELIVQLGRRQALATSWCPRSTATAARSATSSWRQCRTCTADLTDEPAELADGRPRCICGDKFLTAKVAVSGANFAVADDRHAGRRRVRGQRTDVPDPARDTDHRHGHREAACRPGTTSRSSCKLLPRSSTGERMNPYTSIWTGVTAGDGPHERPPGAAGQRPDRRPRRRDRAGRRCDCIRCSACLNVCPVYERVGGHAYGSVYPGPIGAILTPMLRRASEPSTTPLPFASTLCGACYDVCPVKINIPEVLVHLRAEAVEGGHTGTATKRAGEKALMRFARLGMSTPGALRGAQAVTALAGRFVGPSTGRRVPVLSKWVRRPRQPDDPAGVLPEVVEEEPDMNARDEILGSVRRAISGLEHHDPTPSETHVPWAPAASISSASASRTTRRPSIGRPGMPWLGWSRKC